MKIENFEEFFSNVSGNKKELYEAWRKAYEETKKAKRIAKIIIGILDIPGILIILYIFICNLISQKTSGFEIQFTAIQLFSYAIMLLVFDLIIYIFIKLIYSKKNNEYNTEYKNEVINSLLENFIDELDYIPKKTMDREIYNNSGFTRFYDSFTSDDYFEGKISNQKITMADLYLTETTTDSDGNSTTTTVFSGLFGRILLNKSIKTTLKITNSMDSGKRLKMDSSEFEKAFNVYCDDEIIGMQLLTADIMEEILDLYKKSKIRFSIHIYQNIMYIEFHTGHMFEVTGTEEFLNKKELERYFNIMKFVSNLTEKIINVIKETEV